MEIASSCTVRNDFSSVEAALQLQTRVQHSKASRAPKWRFDGLQKHHTRKPTVPHLKAFEDVQRLDTLELIWTWRICTADCKLPTSLGHVVANCVPKCKVSTLTEPCQKGTGVRQFCPRCHCIGNCIPMYLVTICHDMSRQTLFGSRSESTSVCGGCMWMQNQHKLCTVATLKVMKKGLMLVLEALCRSACLKLSLDLPFH